MYLKNIADNRSLPITKTQTVYEQIEVLAEEFGDGMFYGYVIESVEGPSHYGFYTVTLRCANECVASTQFKWNPETRTDLYIGESVDGGKTWEIHPYLLEEYAAHIVSFTK